MKDLYSEYSKRSQNATVKKQRTQFLKVGKISKYISWKKICDNKEVHEKILTIFSC